MKGSRRRGLLRCTAATQLRFVQRLAPTTSELPGCRRPSDQLIRHQERCAGWLSRWWEVTQHKQAHGSCFKNWILPDQDCLSKPGTVQNLPGEWQQVLSRLPKSGVQFYTAEISRAGAKILMGKLHSKISECLPELQYLPGLKDRLKPCHFSETVFLLPCNKHCNT